jgi:hypothetical protein
MNRRTLSTSWLAGALLLVVAIGLCLPGGEGRADAGSATHGHGAAGAMAPPGARLIPAVVYVSADGHVHEIALKGTWQHRDLTAAAAAPVVASPTGRPMAFRRSDGVDMVVYRGADAHIYALYLELLTQGGAWQEVWHCADLTTLTGSPHAGSDPYGYVRSDGISTIVYIGTDGSVNDLRLEGGWIWADLTLIAGAPPAKHNTNNGPVPVAYVRGDGINTVVYTASSNGHIVELRLDNGWKFADLSNISGAPLPAWHLSAYVRSDGISTINYAAGDGRVIDLRLDNGWQWADLTALAGAPATNSSDRVFGYVDADGVNAVLYSRSALDPYPYDIFELWLDAAWHAYNLSSATGGGVGYGPVGYVRADGVSAVVSRGLGANGHIQEVRREPTGWYWADLTQLAGAPWASNTGGTPWPYNRRAVTHVHLPLIVR